MSLRSWTDSPGPLWLAAIAAATLAGACGGSSDEDSSGGGTRVPGQQGCALQYFLTDKPPLAGADPLLAQQWHLSNGGQNGGTPGEDAHVFPAWNLTRGENVRVAVVDDAVEILHTDLAPNAVPGGSFSYRSGNRGSDMPLPCQDNDDHGTSVAGIIAARDNNSAGGIGVAPRAQLVGYNALATSTDVDIADALNRDLALNSIYNNSWGSPDNGVLNAAEPSFVAAIQNGLANGRGGLGTIYVFPGGNGGPGDNANYDGYVNKLGIIAVCAVDDTGRQPFYGEPGANLLVCGPSSNNRFVNGRFVGVTTTTIGDAYRDDFSGTSASTPMVAGVVALMLSANPQLTWRDVRLILAGTARQNDPTDPGWTSAFGYHFNHKYGFGTVDAAAAVAAAQSWTSVGGSAQLKSCGPFERIVNAPIGDASGPPGAYVPGTPVADTITVAGCDISAIEFVEIRLTAPHTYAGDLRIRLVSPNALESVLAGPRGCGFPGQPVDCRQYADWQFGSVRHLGEPANGNWTLELTDMQTFDTGSFDRWSLRFYGR